eukprot:13665354-Ditylum_brightwellii.AAC.1
MEEHFAIENIKNTLLYLSDEWNFVLTEHMVDQVQLPYGAKYVWLQIHPISERTTGRASLSLR